MQRREWFARLVMAVIMIGLPIGLLAYAVLIGPRLAGHRIIDIVAAVPEAGGFQPNAITVQAGETVTLRFRSVDVTHGVAIGPAMGIDLGAIDPGHTKEVTLTFDRGGTYTFYCNTWCSANHWRMRGIVDVSDPAHPNPTPQHDPVIEALATQGVNIDDAAMGNMTPAPMPASLFSQRPSAQRGANLIGRMNVPADLRDLAWQRSHMPEEALQALMKLNPVIPVTDLADVVAYLWIGSSTSGSLTSAASLYAKNCTACHGETGDGKGFASGLAVKPPAAFSDFARMAARRSDVLYAKIRRGGMGTDMPNFGTLFTPEETWALVTYLWTLAFHG